MIAHEPTGIIEHTNGDKHWYLNNKLHREDGPAAEYTNGSKFWYFNGELHREDGPAIEWSDGEKHWYLNSKFTTAEEVFFNLSKSKRIKAAFEIDKWAS